MLEKNKRLTIKEAPVCLDNRGESLRSLLCEFFTELAPQIGALIDEVTLTVEPDKLLPTCKILKENPRFGFNYLRCLSVVDYVSRIEIIYHIYSMENLHKMIVKTSVTEDSPKVPSVTSIWPASNWFEREGHDLFGVEFIGHPDLSPLLLYEDFEGYPGKRSFPFHDYDEW